MEQQSCREFISTQKVAHFLMEAAERRQALQPIHSDPHIHTNLATITVASFNQDRAQFGQDKVESLICRTPSRGD
jgi:hypothetical protein